MSNSVERLHVGRLSATQFTSPANSVTNNSVQESAGIEATKLIHQFALRYNQEPGANIAAFTIDLHIAQATGEVVAIEAVLTGQIPDNNRTVITDLHKSTGAGAFATVLSATVVLDTTSVLRTPEAGTVNTAAYADGDILRLVGTLGGGSGAHPQG